MKLEILFKSANYLKKNVIKIFAFMLKVFQNYLLSSSLCCIYTRHSSKIIARERGGGVAWYPAMTFVINWAHPFLSDVQPKLVDQLQNFNILKMHNSSVFYTYEDI